MKTLIVVSVKGGTGKTTVAIGLAKALHRRNFKVGILDLDYKSPCVPLYLGMSDGQLQHGPGDSLIPVMVDGLAVMSMAYVWPDDKSIMVEDRDAVEDIRQMLTPGLIAWPPIDYLVVDTPPTSSGITVAALSPSKDTCGIAVSHPSSGSRAALLRTLDLLAEKQIACYGIISNQGTDEDGRPRYDLTDADLKVVQEKFHLPLFFVIPHTRTLDPYFDELVKFLLVVKPVILERKEPSEERWRKMVNLASKLR